MIDIILIIFFKMADLVFLIRKKHVYKFTLLENVILSLPATFDVAHD